MYKKIANNNTLKYVIKMDVRLSGFTNTSITGYVETNKDVLVKAVVLGTVAGDTIPNLKKQFGVKTKEKLNVLNVDPAIQDGENCGWTPSGSTSFSNREVETAQLKAQDGYCDRDLLGTFAEYLVKINAQKVPGDLPFEGYIMDEVVRGINEKMEKLVWQGSKTGGDLIDGFLTQALGDDSASTITVTASSATSMYARAQAVIMAIPEDILDKAVLFLSPANFRKLIFELVEKNLYHFAPGADIEDKDVYFPGTEVRIHKTIGLKNNDNIYASLYENMVYGCDLEGDNEKVRFWFDDADELFKYNIRWNAGVKTLFPDMVVVGSIA